jgi:O-antigen/teichoic acid export membrane protein
MAWDRYPEKKWAGHPPEFWIGMILYVASSLAITKFLKTAELQPGLRFLLAAVPLLPLLMMGRGLWRMIQQQDELYKRIQLHALAFACALVIVLSLILGFMEDLEVIPHVNSMWAGQVLVFAWGIGAGLLTRRYR